MPAFKELNQAAGLIIPEIILIATVCIMFLAAPFLVSEHGKTTSGLRHRWGIFAILSLLCAGYAWLGAPMTDSTAGPFISDSFAWFVRGLTLSCGILLTLVLWDQTDDSTAAESFACLLAILAGVNFVALSNDLVGVFLGLELVSIPTYILLYLGRNDWMSREATIKYFLLSIFSSAFVLYGMAWLFGMNGTTNLSAIAAKASLVSQHGMIRVALMLVVAGLSFRLTAVPFHFYAPDVFQGVASSSSAMLSVLPKIVGFAALLRILPVCFGTASFAEWEPAAPIKSILVWLAVITMFLGNILAMRQTNILRLLAYSSIAHAGYMMVGLIVGSSAGATSGVASLLFYVTVYGVVSIGLFALIASAGSANRPVRATADLAGLSRTRPVIAFLMTVCLFGLSGLPPTGGFIGKLNLFLSAWSDGSRDGRILAIVLAVNAVIAAGYYLRLIGTMYFEQSTTVDEPVVRPASWVAGGVAAAGSLLLFLKPQWLWDAAKAAAGILSA
ncbi:MAG: NADH-quinone oxidoreductase subunit N [Planctomycetaceae bacterium]